MVILDSGLLFWTTLYLTISLLEFSRSLVRGWFTLVNT